MNHAAAGDFDPINPKGDRGDCSHETWVQGIPKGIVQAAEVGTQRAVSVMNILFELADEASAPKASR